MSRPRVFVTRQIPSNGIDRLAEHCDIKVWPEQLPPSRDDLLAEVVGCDGLLTLLSDSIDAAVMDAAGEQLRVISNYAVGVNNIDLAEAARRNIRVGNTPDVLTDATADIAATLLLAAARRVKEGLRWVANGHWKTWEPTGLLGADLAGRTLGIVGMGRIGAATARRFARGWDMRILYTARSPKPDVDSELGAEHVEFERLLAESDFVSVHTDLNESTANLFDREAFARMKATAVLVNTARGGVIDQEALVEALRTRQIRAAGLDVTTPEPLPSDHELVDLENCVVLPHIGSATDDSRAAMSEIAADNVIAGLDGKPLRCEVSA